MKPLITCYLHNTAFFLVKAEKEINAEMCLLNFQVSNLLKETVILTGANAGLSGLGSLMSFSKVSHLTDPK